MKYLLKKPDSNIIRYTKKYATMLTWDVFWAATCKVQWAFAPGVCLAADVTVDLSTVYYFNRAKKTNDPAKKHKLIENKTEFTIDLAIATAIIFLL